MTHADEASAVVRDVATAQVHTLAGHPDLVAGEVLEADLSPGPAGVTWTVEAVEARRTVAVDAVDERPVDAAFDAVADRDAGSAVVLEDEAAGPDATIEVHALPVPVDGTDEAVADVIDDEGTLVRAASLGADAVEVRGADGVVTVRYLG